MFLRLCWSTQTLIRALRMRSDLLKEQDWRTNTPHRWRREQLSASTMLVWPSPYGQGRCGPVDKAWV